ncbi:MAG: HAMP domain-containing histidine kinase [Clostridia bacterium]|nr:HAMP domain-containing histidine kinase [Clostridia bacterium]
MKIHQTKKIGENILENYNSENIEEYINEQSFQFGVRIIIVNSDGTIAVGEDRFFGQRHARNIPPMHIHINEDKLGKAFIDDNNFMRMKAVSYTEKIPGVAKQYLYITAPLEPIDATTQVLQNQLVIASLISLMMAFVLAYFMSKKLSKPISDITKSAKSLGMGDYNVRFNQGYYKEIDELADTLNNAADALSKTDELRRDLMANVSHDLRTPLTIIKSYAEMIRDLSGKDDQKRTIHTNVIVDEADRLSLLVNDILDLSKLESGASGLELKKFDLSEVVNATVAAFKSFENDGYVFLVDCCDNAVVCGDFQKIKSVVYNLIANAVNYTGDDKRVYITLQNEVGKIRFSVRDTGNGITQDELPKVWQRYYRASNTHKRASVGTGIGLSIVRTVLKAHKAEFGVDSKVGEGSTFWFCMKTVE